MQIVARGMSGMVAVAMASMMGGSGGPGIQIDGQVKGVQHLEVFLYAGGSGKALADAVNGINRAENALEIALGPDSARGSKRDASAQFDALFDAVDGLNRALLADPLEKVSGDSTGKFAFTKPAPAYADVVMSYDQCGGRMFETHIIKSEQVSGRISLVVDREGEKCATQKRGGG